MNHFSQALVLWKMFGDIPVDDEGYIDIPFIDFPAGTPRDDIWHWFEDTFDGFIVGYALYGRYGNDSTVY